MNRPTTSTPELSVTRTACPPWCVHDDVCQLGVFRGRHRMIAATAAMSADLDDVPELDTVSLFVQQDPRDPAPYVYLDGHHLRLHETQSLIQQLQECVKALAGTLDGERQTLANRSMCPAWCRARHGDEVFLQDFEHRREVFEHLDEQECNIHQVFLTWTPYAIEAVDRVPRVNLYIGDDVGAEMSSAEARSLAAACRRGGAEVSVLTSAALLRAAVALESGRDVVEVQMLAA